MGTRGTMCHDTVLDIRKIEYIADSPGPNKRVTPSISLMAGKSSMLSKEVDVIKICRHIHSSPLGNLKNSPCDVGKADFLAKGVPRYIHAVLNLQMSCVPKLWYSSGIFN